MEIENSSAPPTNFSKNKKKVFFYDSNYNRYMRYERNEEKLFNNI